MNRLLLVLTCGLYVFCSGCGLVSILGTPTRQEQKIKAEYKIPNEKDTKVLVLVDQPEWIQTNRNIAPSLTRAIQNNMIKNIDMEVENFILYEDLSTFKANNDNSEVLSPAQIGYELDADYVLLVEITRFEILDQAQSNYYRGRLDANASLYDAKSGDKLWPVEEEEKAKQIKVGYDIGVANAEIAFKKLIADAAHCTVRYLRDCSVANFRISGERTGEGWQDWER